MEPWGSASLRLIESCKMGPRATTGPNWSQIPLSIALGGGQGQVSTGQGHWSQMGTQGPILIFQCHLKIIFYSSGIF